MRVPFLSSHGLSSKTGGGRFLKELREESPGGMSIDDVLFDAAMIERDIELKQERPEDDISMRQTSALQHECPYQLTIFANDK
jgi:hypothetical protein